MSHSTMENHMIRKSTKHNDPNLKPSDLKAWRNASAMGHALCTLAEEISIQSGGTMVAKCIDAIIGDHFKFNPKGLASPYREFLQAALKARRVEYSVQTVMVDVMLMPPARAIRLNVSFFAKAERVSFLELVCDFWPAAGMDNGKLMTVTFGKHRWTPTHP